MGHVMIRCPVTNRPVATDVATDKIGFDSAAASDEIVDPCPECGGSHLWSKEDAWLEDDSSTTS